MHLSRHFIISVVLAAIAYPFLGWQSVFVFAGGFFVDVDHYLWYVFTHKDFNLRKAYLYHLKTDFSGKKIVDVFHTAEIWILLVIASLFSPYFHTAIVALTLGVYSHILCDLLHELIHYNIGVDARVYSFYARILHLKREKRFSVGRIFRD